MAASWDASLAETMRLTGLAIAEEAVVSQLMDDLRQPPGSWPGGDAG